MELDYSCTQLSRQKNQKLKELEQICIIKPSSPLPQDPFPSSLPDSSVIWDHYPCKSFNCFHLQNPKLGFNSSSDSSKFTTYKTDLHLLISQLFQIAKSTKSVIRLGLDVGGGTGSFTATMKLRNMTVVTTTMSVGAPYSEAEALRGLMPLHMPLQQQLSVFDGVVDLVRCGNSMNRLIPVTMMEFLLFDVDRVLRSGGYLWIDRLFSKGVDLEKLYAPLIGKLGYKKVKWSTGNKTDASGMKNVEIFLTALLQKPTSRLST
ncbi:uncharacterized protein LOC107621431 [Arachis ipaensis]|uniref:uncharacterized protein LOC107621431 n=1 Tax=Arachis ipaensis TaxID=130454 RepID=UPI0007AF984E|nr:uncharacterized protein LOC107621431 [Arachis ipaensis]